MVVTARSCPLIIRVMIRRAGPGQRRNQREECRGMKRAGARPQDDQHADQPDRGRDPAAHADLLAKKKDRQRGDEQRRDEAGGGSFRDRQKPQAGNEEQRRAEQRRAAHDLKHGRCGPCSANNGEPGTIAGTMISSEHQKPDPGDLDRGQRRRQIFRRRIRSAEKNGRCEHQRDAAKRPVGARRRNIRPAVFSAGKGNGALSSLAAAAGRGHG